MLGAYIFIIVISSSWIDHYVCPSLSLFTAFVLKSILSDMSIATPAFLGLYLHGISFSSSFSLYVSLVSGWVSCRQHIQGSCFCIHSASLCLLVGAFNPFTFKVITDKYDPVAIYFIVWGSNLYTLFCVSCLENILQHLLESWFGGAEFSQLLLVCKAFDFSFIVE